MAARKEPEQDPGQGVAAYGQRQLDRVISPATRENVYDMTMSFASERPIFFLFVASQLFFSLLPLVLFVSFAACVALFALGAAVVFTLFWVGVGTLFLVPTLLLTGGLALLVWLWVAAAFIAARWLYNLLPEPEPEAAPGSPPPPIPRDRQQDPLPIVPQGQLTRGIGAHAEGHMQHQDPHDQRKGHEVLE